MSCTEAGVCTYTPTAGYTGPDSFSYTMQFGGTLNENAPESVNGYSVTGAVKVLVAKTFVFLPLVRK